MRKTRCLALSIYALAAYLIAAPSLADADPLIYVTNQETNQVQVLQSADGIQVGSIPVGQSPTGIAIDTNGTFAYVANRGDNTVSRIDLATNTVSATIPLSGNPTAVALTPNGAIAYVVQSTECYIPLPSPTPTPVASPGASPTVSPTPSPTPTPAATPSPLTSPTPTPEPVCLVAAIDTASNSVIASIEVGNEPFDVAVSPSGGFAYVTNRANDSLSVIDISTQLVIDEIDVGATPEGVAVGGGEIYVTNDASNTVTVIRELDLQIVGTVLVGAGPLGVAVAPNGRFGAVSNDQDGSVSIFETGTQLVTSTILVGSNPSGISMLPDSTKGVVANTTAGTVTIFGLDGSGVTTVPVFGSPAEIAITPAPHMTLVKNASPLPAPAGDTVTFSLVYANVGTGPASGIVVTDAVPAHLTFVSATGGGTFDGTTITWSIGAVPAGGSGAVTATFSVEAPLPTGTETTNTATLTEGSTGEVVEATLHVPIRSNPVYDLVAFAPNPFVADGQTTYTITYSNLGTATSVGTQLVATYDPALTYVTSTPLPNGGDNFTWNLGAIPPGGGGTITVTVDIGSPLANGSTITSVFSISDFFGNDGQATAVNTVQSAPALTLAISDVPDPVPADGVILYDVVMTNPGTDSAYNVVLNLGYDPLLSYLGSDVPPDTVAGDIWTIPELGGGDTTRVRIQVQVPSAVPNGTVLTSTATVTDDLGDTASSAVATTVQSAAALSLVATDSPDPVLTGGQITYMLTYANTGSDTATGVVLSTTYSPEITFSSAVPAPDTGTTNIWTLGSLAPGASGTVSIVVDAIAPNGSIATLTGVVSDDLSHSSAATATTVIDLVPALQVGIMGSPEPVQPGSLLSYALTYGNTGTDAASGVVLSTALPSGVIFVSAMPPPDLGTTNKWTIGPLAVGGSGTVTVIAQVKNSLASGTPLLANVTLQDDTGQLVTSSTTNTVQTSQDLALAVAPSIDPIAPGGQVTYTIAYGNPGDTTIIDGILSVVYDSRLSFVASIPSPASSSNDFWLLGDIPPGGGGSVQITLAVDPTVADGSLLGSEVAITGAGGEAVNVAIVSSVQSTPSLSLGVSAIQTVATPAGRIDLTIDYANNGATSVNNLVVAVDVGRFTEVLSTTPAPLIPGVLSWNVGTLTPGQVGSIQLQVLSGAPPGAIASFTATAMGTGVSRAATLNLVAVGAVEWAEVKSGRWQKKPLGKDGGRGRIKFQGTIVLPPTFDGTEGVGVTISSPNELLAAFYMPPGTLIQKGSGYRAKKFDNLLATGGRISLNVRKKGGGDNYKMRVKAANQELPFASSQDLRMSVDLGAVAVSSKRSFISKGPVTEEFQQLRYNGD